MADESKVSVGLVLTGTLRSVKAVSETNKETGEMFEKVRATIDTGEDILRWVEAKAGSDEAAEMQRDLSAKVGQVVSVRCWTRYAPRFNAVVK